MHVTSRPVRLVVSLFALAASMPAVAQPAGAADAEGYDSSEIIVTANKRNERLQDVAASVTVIPTDTLAATGSVKIEDYLGVAPGVSFTNFTAGGGQGSVAIRGITTVGGNPTVATFIDDAPFTGSTNLGGGGLIPDLDPADLDHIEVLRGPQGTLYGGGGMGGVVKYVTKAPDTTEFTGRLQLDGTTIDGGGEGYGIRGAVNVPLTDTLSIRASGFKREDAGFLDNVFTGEKDFNYRKYEGGRVSIGFQPNDMFKVRLSALHQRIHANGNPNVDEVIATGQLAYPDLQTSRAPGSDNSRGRYTFIDLNVEGDMEFATLTSVTAYSKSKFTSNFDYTAVLGPVIDLFFGVPGAGVAIPTTTNNTKMTQELRLAEQDGEALDWQIGGFYTAEDYVYAQTSRVFDSATGEPFPTATPDLLTAKIDGSFEEIAAFGSATYNFSPQFDVTLGARYSHNTQGSRQDTSGVLVGGASTFLSSSSDNAFTWLVNPRFKFANGMMVYARLSTGYRPGGSNAAAIGAPPTYGPDRVTNYEVGIKGDLLDRSLSFDLSAFYIDWSKVQLRNADAFGNSYFENAGKAHSQGIEGSFVYRPVDGLSLAGNLTWNEAETDRDLAAPLVGVKGDKLPYTPEWAGQFSADYRFELSSSATARLGGTYRHVGKRFGAFEAGRTVLPSYDVVDLRAGIDFEKFAVDLFATNVTDKRGRIGNFRFGPIDQIAIIQPRTFGISLTANFGG